MIRWRWHFSGRSAVIDAYFFPVIELNPLKMYSVGLLELLKFNSIPNIDSGSNKLYIEGEEAIVIPTGSYEIDDIQRFVKSKTQSRIVIRPNNNTLRSEVQCDKPIDFTKPDSIGPLLGFTPRVLEANVLHESDQPVRILRVNALRLETNITAGAFINGKRVHTLHQFFPAVPPGYKVIEKPNHVTYLRIVTHTIHHIQLRLVDRYGELVNLRGEELTVRLHLKADGASI